MRRPGRWRRSRGDREGGLSTCTERPLTSPTHADQETGSMFSSPARVHKYMYARACPLRVDHSQQFGKKKESQMCRCGQVRGLVSLHRACPCPAVLSSSTSPPFVPVSFLARSKGKIHIEICRRTFRTHRNAIFCGTALARRTSVCSFLPRECKRLHPKAEDFPLYPP